MPQAKSIRRRSKQCYSFYVLSILNNMERNLNITGVKRKILCSDDDMEKPSCSKRMTNDKEYNRMETDCSTQGWRNPDPPSPVESTKSTSTSTSVSSPSTKENKDSASASASASPDESTDSANDVVDVAMMLSKKLNTRSKKVTPPELVSSGDNEVPPDPARPKSKNYKKEYDDSKKKVAELMEIVNAQSSEIAALKQEVEELKNRLGVPVPE